MQYFCLTILSWTHYLIILVTPEPTTDFQKESRLGIIRVVPKKATEKHLTHIGQTKKDLTLENTPLKRVMQLQFKILRVRKKSLTESTVRRFYKLYKEELKQSAKEKREMKQGLPLLARSRPLIGAKICTCLQRLQ